MGSSLSMNASQYFVYGYVPSQLPSGVLLNKCGGDIVCRIGMFFSSLFTALTPLGAINSFLLLLVTRVCLGLSEVVMYFRLLALVWNWSL